MPAEQEFLVALGANLPSEAGDAAETLSAALRLMVESGLPVRRQSRLFRTPCFPAGAGPDYVNAAAVVAGPSEPALMLARLHAIEARFGRARLRRWGSRPLDLDLLAMGEAVLPDRATQDHWRSLSPDRQMQEAPGQLILPHPRLQDRAFVLVPLLDIAPDWRHPVLGVTVAQMCAALPEEDVSAVVPL